MKKIGFVLIQLAIILILLGGIGDVVYTYSVSSLIPAHIDYLKIASKDISPELIQLDLSFMRGIGGFTIALSLIGLYLVYTLVKKGSKFALFVLVVTMTIGEGNNVYQMIQLDSPFFMMPLFYLIILWVGAFLFIMGKNEEKQSSNHIEHEIVSTE